jgi:phospholipid/cholesterol/gamma-HCH transport system substrate-binding protein
MIQAQLIDRNITGRSTLVRRAIVMIVILTLFGCLVLAYGRGMFSDRLKLSAVIDDAGGALSVGSDVKARGVILGEVTSISSAGDKVRIGMTLDGDHARRVPRNVQARVLAATVFGTTSVDLVVPDGGAASATGLQAGQVIQQDRSTRTLELQDTLDSTDRVLTAIEPAKLATTLSSIAGVLRGRGSELGGTLRTLENYLQRLEPHLPLVQEVLRLAAIDLRVLADTSPDLLEATDNSLTTTRTIAAKRQELATTLTRSRRLVTTADRFLRDQKDQITVTLGNSAVTFDALFDHRSGLAGGFRSFVTFAERGSEGFSDGPFLHTDVYIKLGGGGTYTAADCPRYGPAAGDNCAGGGASSSQQSSDPTPSQAAPDGAGATDPDSGGTDPDAGILGKIEGLLDQLGSKP